MIARGQRRQPGANSAGDHGGRQAHGLPHAHLRHAGQGAGLPALIDLPALRAAQPVIGSGAQALVRGQQVGAVTHGPVVVQREDEGNTAAQDDLWEGRGQASPEMVHVDHVGPELVQDGGEGRILPRVVEKVVAVAPPSKVVHESVYGKPRIFTAQQRMFGLRVILQMATDGHFVSRGERLREELNVHLGAAG